MPPLRPHTFIISPDVDISPARCRRWLVESERAKLPPIKTVFLAFDTFRWKVQLGIRESGGHMSLLLPAVNDECMVVAWAPLSEPADPSHQEIRRHCHAQWHQAINAKYAAGGLNLSRSWFDNHPGLLGSYDDSTF